MTNNIFADSFKMFTDPTAYNAWMQNFTKVDWESWNQSLQDHYKKSFSNSNPKMLESVQELLKANTTFLQQIMVDSLENIKNNMIATAPEEVVANQYKLFKDLYLNYIEHLKSNLHSSMQMATEISDEALTKFIREVEAYLKKNAPNNFTKKAS